MSEYGMSAANCTDYPELQPNPDISGIGVLCAFMVTTYVTLLCCIAKAILDYKRSRSKLPSTPKFDRWVFALGATIVSFSDQQVVTGISIIIGGLSQLQWGISVYHWQSVVNLAWFSTITHLITLTVLRDEVKKNPAVKMFRIFGMGTLIVMLISAMGPVGYIVSDMGIPDAFPAWCLYQPGIKWRYKQSAVWSGDGLYSDGDELIKQYNWLYQFFAMILLVYSFLTRLILLLSNRGGILGFLLRLPVDKPHQPWIVMESWLNRHQRKLGRPYLLTTAQFPNQFAAPGQPLQITGGIAPGSQPNSHQKPSQSFGRLVNILGLKILYSIYAIMVAGNEMYKYKIWEVTWLSLAIAWGTIRIAVARDGVSSLYDLSNLPTDAVLPKDVVTQHGLWGFGQVVALALLIIPLATFFGAFFGEQPQSVPLGNSSPTTSTTSASTTAIRQSLYDNPWYKKLCTLWYCFSLAIGADLIYTFPAGGEGYYIQHKESIRWEAFQYLFWSLYNLAILWISTLVFLDQDLQRLWGSWKVGKYFSKEPIATMGWIFILVCLVGLSVMFDVFMEMQDITGVPDIPILDFR